MHWDLVTPLILTYNESANLEQCLNGLKWANQCVILDSGSTDDTVAIASRALNTTVSCRDFDNHTNQWNYGLSLIKTPWVLTLDADYILPLTFPEEIGTIPDRAMEVAYYAQFRYMVHGRPLRSSLYPPRAVLFCKDRCKYVQDGHTQLLKIEGVTGMLKSVIDHDDRKPLARWLESQKRYTALEASKLINCEFSDLRFQDRLRRSMIFAPIMVFIYTLLIKRTILDGWPGWYYAMQRTYAEILLALQLMEQRNVKEATIHE